MKTQPSLINRVMHLCKQYFHDCKMVLNSTSVQTLVAVVLYNESLPVMEYWHQRADERHGNPPPR